MNSLHKNYLDFSKVVIHVGVRSSVLYTLCYLLYLTISDDIAFTFAAAGVFTVLVMETMSLTIEFKYRSLVCIFVAITSGIALSFGSILGGNILLMSLTLLTLTCLMGLSTSMNITITAVILTFALTFMIGSNFTTSLINSILYGLYFTLGGLVSIGFSFVQATIFKEASGKLNQSVTVNFTEINFNKKHIFFAIRLSIAVLSSYLLAVMLKLHQIYWVPMTALLILKLEDSFTWKRLGHRFVGTIIGSILSIILISLIHNKWVLVTMLFPTTFMVVVALAKHYGAYALFLTALVCISLNIIQPLGLFFAENRIISTTMGVIIVALVTWSSYLIKQRE